MHVVAGRPRQRPGPRGLPRPTGSATRARSSLRQRYLREPHRRREELARRVTAEADWRSHRGAGGAPTDARRARAYGRGEAGLEVAPRRASDSDAGSRPRSLRGATASISARAFQTGSVKRAAADRQISSARGRSPRPKAAASALRPRSSNSRSASLAARRGAVRLERDREHGPCRARRGCAARRGRVPQRGRTSPLPVAHPSAVQRCVSRAPRVPRPPRARTAAVLRSGRPPPRRARPRLGVVARGPDRRSRFSTVSRKLVELLRRGAGAAPPRTDRSPGRPASPGCPWAPGRGRRAGR